MYAESGSAFHDTARFYSASRVQPTTDVDDGDDENATTVDPSFLSVFEEDDEEDPTPDLYAVLGVARDANDVEIKGAYRRLSRLLHPDKHAQGNSAVSADAEAAFGRLTAAYNILSDPQKRAIYDRYGFNGLRIQGWELAVRNKSAPELRLEYLLLKLKAKETENERLLQPSSEVSVGVDMTDFFDRYLKEAPEERVYSPALSVYDVSLSQSITALRTLRNTVNLVGHVTAHNGIGIGTLLAIWERRFPPKTPVIGAFTTETILSYGRGGRGLGASVKVHKAFHERVNGSLGMEVVSVTRNTSAAFSLIPGLSVGTTVQITPRIVSQLQYKWNLGGGLSAEVFWTSEKGERNCRVHTRLSNNGNASLTLRMESVVNWPWLNPFMTTSTHQGSKRNFSDWEANLNEEDDLISGSGHEEGRVSLSLSCNTYDLFEVRAGVNCVLSEITRLSGEFGASWLQGLSVKLGLHRGGQSYVLPLKLSEGWDLAAFGYGVFVPGLTYGVIRSLVCEPWMRAQLKKAQDIRRERLRNELRQLRNEALATQALMQHTAARISKEEKDSNGLVIVRALYGLLSPDSPAVPLTPDVGGPLSIDVTVPLQASVENHQLRLPPGRWADLQGFYNPCFGLGRAACRGNQALRQLYVAYKFNGLPHEVSVDEEQGLAIPMSKHRVDAFSSL